MVGVREGAREPLLVANAAIESRRAADPPGRVAGEWFVDQNRPLGRRQPQLHSRPPERIPAATAVTPAASSPARTSSATIPSPSGSSCSRRTGPGFTTSKKRNARNETIQAAAAAPPDR